MLRMCQYRLINCNNYTTLEGDVDRGGGYTCIGTESMGIFLYVQFCYELKTFFLKKSLKNNNNKNLFVLK